MPIPTRVSSDKPKTAKERIFLEVRDWIITGHYSLEKRSLIRRSLSISL